MNSKIFMQKKTKVTSELAEFVGIMLGDGCCHLKTYQITISSGIIDGRYISEHIPQMIKRLFSKNVRYRKQVPGGIDCIFGSKQVCEMLRDNMNFVSPKTNCEIPKHFFENNTLLKSCVKGLFDTDGGLHRHHKLSAQLKFTNKSHSLINSLYLALKKLGYNPCVTIDYKSKNTKAIYLFSKDVKKYFKEICSNNPKNKLKYEQWIKNGIVPLNKDIEHEVKLTDSEQEMLLGRKLIPLKVHKF